MEDHFSADERQTGSIGRHCVEKLAEKLSVRQLKDLFVPMEQKERRAAGEQQRNRERHGGHEQSVARAEKEFARARALLGELTGAAADAVLQAGFVYQAMGGGAGPTYEQRTRNPRAGVQGQPEWLTRRIYVRGEALGDNEGENPEYPGLNDDAPRQANCREKWLTNVILALRHGTNAHKLKADVREGLGDMRHSGEGAHIRNGMWVEGEQVVVFEERAQQMQADGEGEVSADVDMEDAVAAGEVEMDADAPESGSRKRP